MDQRIDNLIDKLAEQSELLSKVEGESTEFFRLVMNNSLEYDAEVIHKLILSNSENEALLKERLRGVANRIMDNQFGASMELQKLDEEATRKTESTTEVPQETPITEKLAENKETQASGAKPDDNDLLELRNRLLLRRSTSSSFLASSALVEGQNEMHQANQDSILGEMLGLVGQLRLNISQFNESLEADKEAVDRTSASLEKASGTATLVGQKLRIFTQLEKAGFWFYLKVSVGLILVLIVMMFIIWVVPRSPI